MSTAENPFGKPAEDDDDFSLDKPLGEDEGFRIPANDYLAALVDVEKGISSNDNPMWTWKFKIWEGDFRGKEFLLFTVTTAAAMWKLRETLEGLGLGVGGQMVKFKKTDAIGRLAIITLEDDEYKGVKRSSITKVSPHPEGTGKKVTGPMLEDSV